MKENDLSRAAKRLRNLATAATPGPWEFNSSMDDDLHEDAAGWVGHDRVGDGFQEFICATADHPDGLDDGAYIATVHPNVGLALANLLDTLAEHVNSYECMAHCEPDGCDPVIHAISLARLINGGAS